MPKASVLIGEPCTGKSTIMREYLRRGDFHAVPGEGCFRHEDPLQAVCVLGRYDDPAHQFPGTDRLSMGVKPVAMFLADEYCRRGWSIAYEGARLGNGKSFRELQAMGFDLRVGWVVTDVFELQARRALERTQPERFVKRQMTAVRNLARDFGPIVDVLRSDRPADVDRAVEWLMA